MTTPSRHQAKRRIYDQFARISKALAAPARLELLDLLSQGERSVEGLANATELSIANAIAYERDLQAICFATEDAKEGRAAFKEKRSPVFKRR